MPASEFAEAALQSMLPLARGDLGLHLVTELLGDGFSHAMRIETSESG